LAVETITLGCRLNFAESETIARNAPPGDWLIVNSCAVTSEAVRQTRQAIRRVRRARPEARILVTGCAVELEPASFEAMPEVSRVVGNKSKMGSSLFSRHPGLDPGSTFSSFAGKEDGSRLVGRDDEGNKVVPAGNQGHVRSFVAVQTGCDHSCTFCSIAPARGPSRSFTYAAIREAVESELDRGAREIVLTGVDITSYKGGLGPLVEQLLRDLPQLKRLRLSSLDSIEIDESLFALIAGEPRLLPHFHLSLQSGDDLILKRMKRRHSRAEAVRTVERIKAVRPDATIGADLIAGFPTESEEAALNTLRLLDDCDVIAGHIFPFSPRPGTPASRMPQLERETIKARAALLRARAAERRSAWLASHIGKIQPVLMENGGKGHTSGFAPVEVASVPKGTIFDVRMTGINGDRLRGVPA
jgi:threonylcarbamoyladenosine tRNA methylthiotransferase MtaB